jgi:diaminobutyrate-2-oxoglutarate transaminase
MPLTIIDQLESNVRYYCRRFPSVFSRAQGSLLWDTDGNAYIDLFSGSGALNYGHSSEPAKKALVDYILGDGIVHSLDLITTAKIQFMTEFEAVILRPRNLKYRMMFPGPTGTNAIEAALKLARMVTNRPNIIAFTNAFHGVSLGSLAATATSRQRRAAGISLTNVDRLPFDGYMGTATDSIQLISKLLNDPGSGIEHPAAFLVETIQAEGGVNVASDAWLRDLAALAIHCGSLLIIDDIQVGCGRSGTFFSFEAAGILPDIVCLSKSLSGFGLPLSMVLIRPDIDVWQPGDHNGTFRGNNHAFVTATAVLKYWTEPRFLADLIRNTKLLDQLLVNMLAQEPSYELKLRGRGLIRGIVCPSGIIASGIASRAFERRVLVETCGPHGEVLKLLPPLNIEPELLEEAIGRIGRALPNPTAT